MAASSRESKAGAGWDCAPGRYRKLMDDHGVGRRPPFSGLSAVPLRDGEMRIRCFAATGCQAQEDASPVEDHLVAIEDPAGRWTWAVV